MSPMKKILFEIRIFSKYLKNCCKDEIIFHFWSHPLGAIYHIFGTLAKLNFKVDKVIWPVEHTFTYLFIDSFDHWSQK